MVVLALVKMAEWKLRHGPKDVIEIDEEDDMTEEKGEGCWFRKIQKRRLLAQEKQKEVASRLSFACRQKLEKAEEKRHLNQLVAIRLDLEVALDE